MDKYEKDQNGQWWCITPKQRQRVIEKTCFQCGKKFLNRHDQKFCSAACRALSTAGLFRIKRVPRDCAWCKKSFYPKFPSSKKICCSLRCAYNLGNTKRGLKGDRNPRWRGGVSPHGGTGYLRQYAPGRGMILQHRLVMEKKIGRPLLAYENIHHLNGIRHDNRPENLELWAKQQPPGQRANEQKHCPTCTCCKS